MRNKTHACTFHARHVCKRWTTGGKKIKLTTALPALGGSLLMSTVNIWGSRLGRRSTDQGQRTGRGIKGQVEGSGSMTSRTLSALAITGQVPCLLDINLVSYRCLESFGGEWDVLKGLLQRFDSSINKPNNTLTNVVEIQQVLLMFLCMMLICWCWNNGYDMEYGERAYPLASDKLFMRL